MKTLLIVRRIFAKRKKSAILLMIEIVLSLIILMGIISKIIYLQETKNIAFTFNGSDAYYFTPYTYYTPDFDITDYLPDNILENIRIGDVSTTKIIDKNGREIKCIKYSDTIIEKMQLTLQKEEFSIENSEKYIYAIATDDGYGIGDIIELDDKTKLKIIDTISSDAYIVCFNHSGSSGMASINDMVEKIDEHTIIIPSNEKRYNTLPNEEYDFMYQNSKIVEVTGNLDEGELKDELRKYGDVSSIDEMNSTYYKDNREFFMINMILFFVIAILTTVGITGTNAIQSEMNSKMYSIMYICGMNSRKNMIVEGLVCFITLIIGYLSFLLLYIFVGSDLFGTSIKLGWSVHIIVFAYLFIVYLLSSSTFIIKVKKHNLSDLYKRG